MPLWLWLIPQHPLLVILDVKNPLAPIFPSWRHDHPRDQILQNLTDLVKGPSSPYELFQCCRSYSCYAKHVNQISPSISWGITRKKQVIHGLLSSLTLRDKIKITCTLSFSAHHAFLDAGEACFDCFKETLQNWIGDGVFTWHWMLWVFLHYNHQFLKLFLNNLLMSLS